MTNKNMELINPNAYDIFTDFNSVNIGVDIFLLPLIVIF